jgi:hypothetical protein
MRSSDDIGLGPLESLIAQSPKLSSTIAFLLHYRHPRPHYHRGEELSPSRCLSPSNSISSLILSFVEVAIPIDEERIYHHPTVNPCPTHLLGSSSSNLSASRNRWQKRLELSLIRCTKCDRHRVLEFKLKIDKNGNEG